jgi:hypothetical protein
MWRQRFAQGDISIGDLNLDIDALSSEAQQAEDEAKRLRDAADTLRAEREALVGLRNFLGAPTPEGTGSATNGQTAPRTRRSSKREAIIAALQSGPLSTAQVRDELVANGVIDDEERAYHALRVTLSQMFRKNQLSRPSMGVYELARGSAQSE